MFADFDGTNYWVTGQIPFTSRNSVETVALFKVIRFDELFKCPWTWELWFTSICHPQIEGSSSWTGDQELFLFCTTSTWSCGWSIVSQWQHCSVVSCHVGRLARQNAALLKLRPLSQATLIWYACFSANVWLTYILSCVCAFERSEIMS